MSSDFELDFATLHTDTNISHTIALANVTTSSNALEELLNLECCTLREIISASQLKTLDITKCSIETQLEFLTQLVSERFDSTCFTNANDTMYVKCFFSPDPGICISKWSVTPEEASIFKDKTKNIPVHSKLPLACLLTDHQYVQTLMEHTCCRDLVTTNLLFYGISCKEIVDIILSQVDKTCVNAKDTRGRTPLFYALTSSMDSARKLLKKGACVTITDKCNVNVLTYFAENISKKHLCVPIKDEGLGLLSSSGMERKTMIKELINLIFCKCIQVLGSMFVPSNSQDGYLKPRMLCETLKWVLGQNDERNTLINQLQSMQENVPPADKTCDVVFDILRKLGAEPSEARDSEGNTCLHYAARLIFHGVPKETVTYICHQLMEMDPKMKLLDVKNHKEETPLLFCFSSTNVIASSETNNWSAGRLQAVCKVLVDKGSKLGLTTRKEESAFQLILKLLQYAILMPDETDHKRCIFKEMSKILEMFSSKSSKVAVNTRDIHLNSSLHLWASLALKSSRHYTESIFDNQSFEEVLKHILELLLKCGVLVNDSNEKGETPLHVCRTWTAVKLLLDAGANPTVKDSSGRTPLLAAAMNNTCLKKGSNSFYPDVTEDVNEFWKDVLHRKLDPWAADKEGESVLSTLIDKEANDLSKVLIECACNQKMQIDTIGIPLLVTICKDKSIDKDWKFDLVKKLLDTKRSLVHGRLSSSKDTALHFCCRSILELPENTVQSSVQWKIIQYLLMCGADVTTAGESDESCEDLSHDCPLLRNLLSTPVDYSKLPIVLNQWKESSVKHKKQLSLVARMVKCQQIECKRDSSSLHLSNEPLDTDKGSFGLVFVGIIHDGREVAVKRIDKSSLPSSGVKSVLVPAQQCDQIVRYIFCKEDQHFHYVAFDLMEGNLEDYLDRPRACRSENTKKPCKDVLLGLQFLQCQGVVHGNINPRTVFYQIQASGMCLKIGNCVARSHRRGWIASEVLNQKSAPPVFSNQSDMFSFGLVLHYLLSEKKHPFAPVNCTTKTPEEILLETENNIKKCHIVRLDDSLSPEATHLVQLMLNSNASSRPSAAEALAHPFFWDIKTKKNFLHVVGNEEEIAKQGRCSSLIPCFSDLEKKFSTIVTKGSKWNDSPQYDKISATEAGMKVKPKNGYNYSTIAGLVRFIRNAYEHIHEQPDDIKTTWKTDFVLNDYFPNLVIEVYKALTNHGLHKSREEIEKFFSEL